MKRRKFYQRPRQSNSAFSAKMKVVRDCSPYYSHYYIIIHLFWFLRTLAAVLENFKTDINTYLRGDKDEAIILVHTWALA